MTKYLRINQKEGYLYQSFKEQNSQGTLKVVSTIDGTKYYHQLYGDIKGIFIGIEKKDFVTRGTTIRQLVLKFRTEAEYVHVTINLDDKYRLDGYFLDFIKVMGNLRKGMPCIFSTNTTKKNNKGNVWSNLYFTNTETNMPIVWSIDPKEIPAKEEKVIEGKPGEPDKTVPDYKKQDKYLYKIFEQEYPALEEVPFQMPAASDDGVPAEKFYPDELPF